MATLNINTILQDKSPEARPPVPMALHEAIAQISEMTHIKQFRLYAEILAEGLPKVLKKYGIDNIIIEG